MPPIYLDHNATTPMLPEVADAVREASLRFGANPASQHEPGRQARRALKVIRHRLAELLCATVAPSLRDGKSSAEKPPQLIFTSGGTESNNLALIGLTRGGGGASPTPVGATSPTLAPPAHLVISALEHPSIARTADHLSAAGLAVERLPADVNGVVEIGDLASRLRPNTRLVSVMLASNETGVLQPVAAVAALCRQRGILCHTDATQVVGKLPVDFAELGVDALTCTAHKFHGPPGIGALIVRHGVQLEPVLWGGFQQAGMRPGTEPIALAAGMLAALEAWAAEADARRERLAARRDQLERQLLAGDPRAVALGAAAPRLPNTSNIAFVGLDRQALAMALDLAGIACSTGSACASGSSEPSPALVAMGLPEEQISSSLRFSVSATTTAAEIDEGARRILAVIKRLRRE